MDPPVSFCDDPSDVVGELSTGGVVTRPHPFLDDPKAHGPWPRGLHEGLNEVPVLGLKHQRPQDPVTGLERGAEVGHVLLLQVLGLEVVVFTGEAMDFLPGLTDGSLKRGQVWSLKTFSTVHF